MKHLSKAVMIAVLGMLGACQYFSDPVSEVIFIEQEKGIDPYKVRMLANSAYLRIDDGEGSDSYIVFDRRSKTIYNVNASGKTVMTVRPQASEVQPPFPLIQRVQELGALNDAPKIDNKTPQHRQLFTNEKLCIEVISVPGLMSNVVQGMAEMQHVLADDSATTFHTIPADLHQPCELAANVFSPAQQLQFGFPVREWRPDGYSRSLFDFKVAGSVEKSVFEVPQDYFSYSVQQLRDGLVDFERREVINPNTATKS